MNKKLLKVLFVLSVLAILFTMFTFVNATTIDETTKTNDGKDTIAEKTIVIGVTKFTPGTSITAAKAAKAGANDYKIYIAQNKDPEKYTDPAIYYYVGEDIWFTIDEDGEAEPIDAIQTLDIYYVDNEPKKEVSIPVAQEQGIYTVSFMNDSAVFDAQQIKEGNKATAPKTNPTKTGYTFKGWFLEDKAFDFTATINKDTVLVANWEINKFAVKFVNDDGTELQSGDVAYGTVPAYTGATPTKAADAQYTYTFAGWDKEVVEVTGNATYKATYTSKVNEYLVTFTNDDDSFLSSKYFKYGETVVYPGTTPVKAATAEFTYAFAGWTPALDAVTGDVTYKATYTHTTNEYTITFVNEDGTELSSEIVEYGTVPTAPIATKGETNEYTYTFAGWDNEVVAVTGDATYTATYTQTAKEYTVTYMLDGATYGKVDTVAYGTALTARAVPAAKVGYTFSGWSEVPATMPAENIEITGTFVANPYKVTAAEATHGTVTTDKTTGLHIGDEVTVTITPDTGYEIGEVTGVTLTDGKFTMPANDVEITVTFKAIDYTVTVEETTHGTVTASKTTGLHIGDEVTVTITPDTGYEVDEVTGVTLTDGKFTMPAKDAIVTVTFKQTDYKVTVAEATHGTVTTDKTTGLHYGDEVTLTFAAETGYVLNEETFKVTDVEGKKLTITADPENANKYTFTMPASNITVSASFELKYQVNVKEGITDGTVEVENGAEGYFKGDIVKLTVTPDLGYELESITATYGGASKTPVPVVEEVGEEEVTYYEFEIDARDVTVNATFAKIDYTINKAEASNGTFTVPATAQIGDTVTVVPTPAEGYVVDTITVKDADNNDVTVTTDTFTMPAKEVTVTVTFKLDDYTITKADATNGAFAVKVSDSEVTTAQMGNTVTIVATPDVGYELDTITVKDADNNDITVTENAFTMPAKAVTVTVTFKLHDYTITKADTANGSFDVNATAKMNEEVTITATPDEGYQVKAVTVTKSDDSTVTVTGTYTFTMPTDNVTVSVEFELIPRTLTVNKTVGGNANVKVNETETTTAVAGDSVVVTATPTESRYVVKEIKVDGTAVEFTVDESTKVATYTFVMPAADVTVDVTFEMEYKVTIASMEHGNVTAEPVASFRDTEIKLTVTPDEGYSLKAGTLKATQTNNKTLTLTENTDGTYTFTIQGRDVTVSAEFVANQYTMTFKLNNSEADVVLTQYFGTTITAPTPTKTGYAFTGWDAEVPTTMPAEDKTFTASWTEKVVSYDGTKLTLWDGTEEAVTSLATVLTDPRLQDAKVTLTGNVTENAEVTVPAKMTLTVNEGVTLTVGGIVASDSNITNNGTIVVNSDVSSGITAAQTAFVNDYYNKASGIGAVNNENKKYVSGSGFTGENDTALQFKSDTYYVNVGKVPTGYTISGVTINGHTYSSTAKKQISVGNNNYVVAPVFKVESDTLYIALPWLIAETGSAKGITVEAGKYNYNVTAYASESEGSLTLSKAYLQNGGGTLDVDFENSIVTEKTTNKTTARTNYVVGVVLANNGTDLETPNDVCWRINDTQNMGVTLSAVESGNYTRIESNGTQSTNVSGDAMTYSIYIGGWNSGALDAEGKAESNVTLINASTHKTIDLTFKFETLDSYTVTWKNGDEVVETDTEVIKGTVPTFDGSEPTKTADAEYTYTFAGWTPEVVAATEDVTYTAKYSTTTNKYTIKFVNDDGTTVLSEKQVEYGTVPTCAEPTKTGHNFAGWDTTPVAVTGNATYKATYSKIDYTITGVSTEKGNVTANATANYEETVTLTVAPVEDYDLVAGSLKVTTESGTELELTKVDDTHYTFTMLAENVTISANFTDLYTIKVIAGEGTIKVGDEDLNGKQYVENDNVNFTVTPNDGYVLKDLTIKETYEGNTTLEYTPAMNANTETYSFKMQGIDVTVVAKFAKEGASEATTPTYVEVVSQEELETALAENSVEEVKLITPIEVKQDMVIDENVTISGEGLSIEEGKKLTVTDNATAVVDKIEVANGATIEVTDGSTLKVGELNAEEGATSGNIIVGSAITTGALDISGLTRLLANNSQKATLVVGNSLESATQIGITVKSNGRLVLAEGVDLAANVTVNKEEGGEIWQLVDTDANMRAAINKENVDTIVFTDDINTTSMISIPSGKTKIFDLNSHEIKTTGSTGISNNGTLTLKNGTLNNTKTSSSGVLNGVGIRNQKNCSLTIENSSILSGSEAVINLGNANATLNNVEITSSGVTSSYAIKNDGTIIVENEDEVLQSNRFTVHNKSTGNMYIKGGSIIATTANDAKAIVNDGTINVENVDISSEQVGIENRNNSTATLNNVNLTTTSENAEKMFGINNQGTLTYTNGTVKAKNIGITNTNTVELNNVNVTSTDYYAVYSAAGTTTINGGTIQGDTSAAIYNSSTLISNGATINTDNDTDNSVPAIYANDNSATTINGGKVTSKGFGITVWENAELTVKNAEVTAEKYYAIAGNGTKNIKSITIDNSNVTSNGAVAIFMPSAGDLLITNYSSVKGLTGIETLAGKISIANSTIEATGEYNSVGDKTGDGTICDGSAIFVRSQAGYNNDGTLNLTVQGTSTLKSANGYGLRVYESSKGAGVKTINVTYPDTTVFTVTEGHNTLVEKQADSAITVNVNV